MAAGRTQDAVSEVRAALDLNRWSNWYSGLLAQYLFFAGDRQAALIEARAAVERFPEVEISHMLLSIVTSGAGMHEEATGLVRTIEARGIAAHCPWLATAYLALGRRDRAIDVLARAREVGSPQFVYAFVDPRLADLDGDPAFERLRPVLGPRDDRGPARD